MVFSSSQTPEQEDIVAESGPGAARPRDEGLQLQLPLFYTRGLHEAGGHNQRLPNQALPRPVRPRVSQARPKLPLEKGK